MNTSEFGLLIFLFLLSFFSIITEPSRWYFYLKCKYSFKKLFLIIGGVISLSYLFPFKLGLPLRCYFLSKFLGVNMVKSTSLMAIEGFGFYLIWGLFALLASQFFLESYYESNSWIMIALLSTLAIFVVLSFCLYLFRGKFRIWLLEVLNTVLKFDSLQIFFISILFFLEVFLQVARHIVIFKLLNINLEFNAYIAIAIISFFAGMLSMMPLGLGGYDTMIVTILTSLGVDFQQSLLVPLINRLTVTIVVWLVGLFCLSNIGLSFSQIKSILIKYKLTNKP